MTQQKLALAYVSNARIPGDRAHSHQSVLVCEALQRAGADVELIHPVRRRVRTPAAFSELARVYGIEERFRVTQLYSLDLIDLFPPSLQQPWFLLQELTYAASLRQYLADKPEVVVYVRDPHTLFFLQMLSAALRGRIVFEAHRVPRTRIGRRLLRGALANTLCIVVLNRHLAKEYAAMGVAESRIAVVPSAVDTRKYQSRPCRREQRQRLHIPESAPVVGYAGSLLREKGIHTLLESASQLPQATLLVLGGWPPVVPQLQDFCRERNVTNVRFAGRISPLEVPGYLMLADVLVVPNSARSAAAAEDTSPLKFFEYAAAGKPIVASDVPALRDAAAECEGCAVVWVRPDDAESLAAGIRAALAGDVAAAARPAMAPDWLDRARDTLRHIHAQRPEPRPS